MLGDIGASFRRDEEFEDVKLPPRMVRYCLRKRDVMFPVVVESSPQLEDNALIPLHCYSVRLERYEPPRQLAHSRASHDAVPRRLVLPNDS